MNRLLQALTDCNPTNLDEQINLNQLFTVAIEKQNERGKVNKLHTKFKAREHLREIAWVTQKPFCSGQRGYSDSKRRLKESQMAAVSSSSGMPFAEALADKHTNYEKVSADE